MAGYAIVVAVDVDVVVVQLLRQPPSSHANGVEHTCLHSSETSLVTLHYNDLNLLSHKLVCSDPVVQGDPPISTLATFQTVEEEGKVIHLDHRAGKRWK